LEKLFNTDAIKPQNSVLPWNFPQKALTSHPHISFGKNLSYPYPLCAVCSIKPTPFIRFF
jgi:hypothetical protein